MSSSFYEDVREFHDKFEIRDMYLQDPQLVLQQRLDLLQSEVNELAEAQDRQNIEKIADALTDILYVVLGTISLTGFPIQELWDEVHRSNMEKEVIPESEKTDEYHVVRKPKDWHAPELYAVILRQMAEHDIGR